MQKYVDLLKENILSSIQAKQDYLADGAQMEIFATAVRKIVDSYKKGGRLYIAGNGGSAGDAQHLAAEFVSKLARPRDPLPAEALTVCTSTLTAIGNDYGFEKVFSRQIRAKATPRDVFLAITTSGVSENILLALRTCRELEVPSVLLSGRDGGEARALADYAILAKGSSTSEIQEVHISIYHALCACVENELFPE